MVQLSVNVNKVATLRNSRGGAVPDVGQAVRTCVAAGAYGITVHPRADERHVTRADVRTIAQLLRAEARGVEYNLEGDPRDDYVALVTEVRPTQATLVPVRPGEITSQAGWSPDTPLASMRALVGRLRADGIRVSLFVEPVAEALRWAASVGADRIELYTEPYARAWEHGRAAAEESFARYAEAATLAHELGLGVNAGHDLNLDNLTLFRTLPFLDEVSIGHALISDALYLGLAQAVAKYVAVLRGA